MRCTPFLKPLRAHSVTISAGRCYTTAAIPEAGPSKLAESPSRSPAAQDELRRKRRTDWKRRQNGQSFLDHTIIHIRAGNGGNGCVAFHRELFKPYGPPSGGNGGRGADVYILPTPHLTTLSSVPNRIRAPHGGSGQGTWQNGRNAPPLIVRVPLGTIVRELPRDDPRRHKDEYEAEAEDLQGLKPQERRDKMRERRWVHYPEWAEDNAQREDFKHAERVLFQQERERRRARRMRAENPIFLDLDKPEETAEAEDPNAPLGHRRVEPMGHLVAQGGAGGVGNPAFLSPTNRSPKWATRGYPGERVSLALELKLLADVGLVGMPNAGKSTLLRALTGGRARTEVAGYAFTTLNPVVGVVRVAADGSFAFDGPTEGAVHDETSVEEARERELMVGGEFADALTRNQRRALQDEAREKGGETDPYELMEAFRFTVADNPGLIEDASADVGLGHSFLRSIERSHALAYVVDLSGEAPWDELRVLREELERYKPGMSANARIVIANKADLLGGEGASTEDVEEAKAKLGRLERYVREEMKVPVLDAEGNPVGSGETRTLDLVPVSAKFSLNLRKVVGLMQGYVEEARMRKGIDPGVVGRLFHS
ncbi:GTP-binding protein Obg/CgtA [Dichomitus squalens]|uniref:GTP-binding protein Obg/CgtA n=1 Tax=Dichomitus squalens TaxID=114155 RepID=A0A4Q9ME54_9APHY|nr:GTP-binding protein Obg/CgtA [Dichomitus squalens]